jgi:hypothetical protein
VDSEPCCRFQREGGGPSGTTRRRAEAVLVVQYVSRSPPTTDAIATSASASAGVGHRFDAASVPLVTDRVRSTLRITPSNRIFRRSQSRRSAGVYRARYPIWSVPTETHLTDVSGGTRRAAGRFLRSVSPLPTPFPPIFILSPWTFRSSWPISPRRQGDLAEILSLHGERLVIVSPE